MRRLMEIQAKQQEYGRRQEELNLRREQLSEEIG